MEETDPKALFTGIGVEVQLLYQKPNDERWRKLPAQTKDKARAYTMVSRFVPQSEATDGISCHDDFAGTARLYLSSHQIQTSTPTRMASDIPVVQWKQFFVEVLSGPTTLIGKTKLPKGDTKRKETIQFMTNLSHSDPLLLFADSTKEGVTTLTDNNIGKVWAAAISVLGCYYPRPLETPTKQPTKKSISFALPKPPLQVTPQAKTPAEKATAAAILQPAKKLRQATLTDEDKRPFRNRIDLSLKIMPSEDSPVQAMLEKLNEWYSEVKKEEPRILILPWKRDSELAPIREAKDIPTKISELQKYLPRAQPPTRSTRNMMYTQAQIATDSDPGLLITKKKDSAMDWWYEENGGGVYIKPGRRG